MALFTFQTTAVTMSCVTRVLVRPFFAPTYSPSFGRPLSRARVLSAMEAPLEASALSSYLSIQKALTAVRREGKGNQLGWVPYRPAQLEDYPERPADWESACEKQCEKLGIDSGETKCHLEWATGLAGSIDKGQKAFCYGAVHRFPDHDVKHAQLVVHPTATAPAEKAKASLRNTGLFGS